MAQTVSSLPTMAATQPVHPSAPHIPNAKVWRGVPPNATSTILMLQLTLFSTFPVLITSTMLSARLNGNSVGKMAINHNLIHIGIPTPSVSPHVHLLAKMTRIAKVLITGMENVRFIKKQSPVIWRRIITAHINFMMLLVHCHRLLPPPEQRLPQRERLLRLQIPLLLRVARPPPLQQPRAP